MIVELHSDHGYTVLALIATQFVLIYLGMQVYDARKVANVPYPNLYASGEEAEKDRKKHVFNCTQRGHHNTLESIPSFLILFGISSIEYPKLAALSGVGYLVSRIIYAIGYSSGIPDRRYWGGALTGVPMLTLLVCSLLTAYHVFAQ
ncbi:hypothetical protein HDV01_007468 [Terramyces sp. JEL0728]|nr:hypothetical protein HDV01_007468 [Terramyces sp. JEL0728]